jgi:hypothetical protein
MVYGGARLTRAHAASAAGAAFAQLRAPSGRARRLQRLLSPGGSCMILAS